MQITQADLVATDGTAIADESRRLGTNGTSVALVPVTFFSPMKTVVLLCSLMAVSSHAADKTGAAPFSSRTANVHTLTLLPGPTLTSPAGSTSRSFKWSSARPVTMSAARAAIGSSQAAGSKVPADIPPAPPANEPSFGSPPALDFRQKLPELKTTLQTRP